jgi:hypothetical protein
MPLPKTSLQAIILSLLLLMLCGIFSMRTLERVAITQTPDSTHVHQIYAGYDLSEEFTSQARGLSGIGIFAECENLHEQLTVKLEELLNARILSQTQTTVANAGHIEIPRQASSAGKRYKVTFSAPNTPKSHAIKVEYESDATKYSDVVVSQNNQTKQGSLGFIQYERPTIALSIARWLALPHQRGLWAGVVVVMISFVLRKRIHPTQPPLEKGRRSTYSPPFQGGVRGGAYFLLIVIACLVIYWPATHLFFYSDDVPILARIPAMLQTNPLLLLTPHRILDADPTSQFGFDFYRPISFSLYPLLLHVLFSPNAALYYFLNILLFAGIACCLFIVGKRITKSIPAGLLITALWVSHSSKLGLLYWWSSVQDLLASLFAMLSVVLYFKWKDSGNSRIHITSIIVFAVALFSKEYIIVTPIIIGLLELLEGKISRINILQTLRNLLPYIITAGIFLIINTAVLGDPTLPAHKHTDQTYSLSINPVNIIRNIVVYASFTAEKKLWPQTSLTQTFENYSSNILELWRLKTSGPYYSGVFIILIAFICLIIFWKDIKSRNILLFGIFWWILFISPFLLFTSDWRARWLTLSTFGSSLFVVTILQKIIPKKTYLIWYVLICIALLYGFNIARDPQLTKFFQEQSAYTHEAYNQLKTQEIHISDEKRIILIGITPDQQTSLNAYLFRLYAKNPNADIIYAKSLESLPREALGQSGDVIINMTGIIPYYPESEK